MEKIVDVLKRFLPNWVVDRLPGIDTGSSDDDGPGIRERVSGWFGGGDDDEELTGSDSRRRDREAELARAREQEQNEALQRELTAATGGRGGMNTVTNANIQNNYSNSTTALAPARSTKPSGPTSRYSTAPDAP